MYDHTIWINGWYLFFGWLSIAVLVRIAIGLLSPTPSSYGPADALVVNLGKMFASCGTAFAIFLFIGWVADLIGHPLGIG